MGSRAFRLASRTNLALLIAAAISAGCSPTGSEVKQAETEPVAQAPAAPSPADQNVQAAAAPAEARAPAVAESTVEVAPPAEESVAPLFDRATSFGHQAGLHRVKDDLRLSASAALVVDQDSGEVLLRRNETAVLPVASLTKLMTALVLTEAKLPMDEVITVTDDDVDGERHSRSRLRVGTALTRSEALHIALMSSENRAAHALGRTFPGGMDAFVKAMNRKAAALGMKNTTYVDPTGLSNRNQSTALDLAALAAAASKNAMLAEYTTDRQHLLQVARGRAIQYNNSNRLVKNPRWDIELQKTGYIVEAGWCMVLDTKIGRRNVLVVLLDAGGAGNRIADAERLKHLVSAHAGDTAEAGARHTKS
jgi:D-alanyl-D-alanine endopeptidase (penicillin-binding protein 7)